MEQAPKVEGTSSGTSALDAGLGIMPTDEAQLANAMEMFARMVEKYVRVCRALKQECRDADELLNLLRLDPERYRTEGGYINLPKVRAALANPDDYPMLPNAKVTGSPALSASPRGLPG